MIAFGVSRWPQLVAAALLASLLALALAVTARPLPAGAAEANTWAGITVSGSSGAYTGTVAMPANFPVTTFTSTSRQATVPTGASTWQAASTPVGAAFGSSLNRPYLNLRPAADNASSPAVTTYTFATPTPSQGWAFVLGDIDADQVTLSATGANGAAVLVSALGFQGSFNYCHRSGGPSCDSANRNDLPVWTVNGNSGLLIGNSTATDSEGAAAWFRPTESLTSITMSFQQRSGLPVYQTWFAAKSFAVSGVVTLDGTPLPGSVVTVRDENDQVVGTATADSVGAWSLPALMASGPYRAEVAAPSGIAALAPREFSLVGADAAGVDFPFVTPPPPAAVDDSDTTTQGAAISVDLGANDSAGSADFPLVISSMKLALPSGAASGTVLAADGRTLTIPGEGQYVLSAAGVVQFTPEPAFSGAASVVPYSVTDARGATASSTLVITVTPVTPVALPNDLATQRGVATTATLLNNDAPGLPSVPLVPSSVTLQLPVSPPPGSTVSADGKILTIAGEGTYTVLASGSVDYQPDPDFTGTATTVPYTVADANGTLATSTLTVVVSALPVPIASPNEISIRQGVPFTGNPLGNDVPSSPSASFVPSSMTLVLPAGAPAGSTISDDGRTLTIAGEGVYVVNPATGDITFTPDPSFTGDATPIDYTIADTTGESATAAIIVTVIPVTPTAAPDSATTRQGQPVGLTPLDNDVAGNPAVALVPATLRLQLPPDGPAGSSLSADGTSLTIPGEGSYVVDSSGGVVFSPELAFTGEATAVPYSVTDANGTVAASVIAITVGAVVPVAASDAAGTLQAVPVVVDTVGNDLPGDDTAPLDATTVRLALPTGAPAGTVLASDGRTLTIPGAGVFTVGAATGSVTFTPDKTFTGAVSVVPYSISDANGTTASAEISVSVEPVTPAANADEVATASGTPVVIDLLANDLAGGPSAALDPTTVTLQAPAVAGAELSDDGITLTIPGVGVFTLDPSTGRVTFVPAAGFSGRTPDVPYTVADANGTTAASVLFVQVAEPEQTPIPTPTPTPTPTPGGSAPSIPGPSGTAGSSLAATGSDPAPGVMIALALIALGLVGSLQRRRRLQAQPRPDSSRS